MRSCGGCNLCCIIPAIPELGKPVDTRCEHLTDSGCGIYHSPRRPQACRDFNCGWLEGLYGDGTARPDWVGAYVTGVADGDGLDGSVAGMMVRALDNSPKNFEASESLMKLVRQVLEGGRDVLVASGERRRVITRNLVHLTKVVRDGAGNHVSVELA